MALSRVMMMDDTTKMMGAASITDLVKDTWIDWGTSTDQVNASDMPANFASPANYTPDSADVKGHLSGIDTAIGNIAAGLNFKGPTFSKYQFVTGTGITGTAIKQGQVIKFTGQPDSAGPYDILYIYDGVTQRTYGPTGSGANVTYTVGATVSATIQNLAAAIEGDGSKIVRAQASNFPELDNTNNVLVLSAISTLTAFRTWAADSGAGAWTNIPQYINVFNGTSDDAVNLTSTDPTTSNFSTVIDQSALIDGDTYVSRSCGCWERWDNTDNEWVTIMVSPSQQYTGGLGITIDTTTEPDSIKIDQTASLPSISGDWNFASGKIGLPTASSATEADIWYTGSNLYFRTASADAKVWTDQNDGTTSGLDADLLDGNHAAAFSLSGHNQATTAGGTAIDSSTLQGIAYLSTTGTWTTAGAIAAGALPYGSATNTLSMLAKGTSYQVLRMNVGQTLPEWGMAMPVAGGTGIDTSGSTGAALVTGGTWSVGTLGATMGGTGQTTVAVGDLLIGSGTNTWGKLTPIGTNGQVLTSNGTTAGWSTPASAPNSFETMACPAGTNPVADSGTDTLTWTSTGGTLVITGNATTDTINLDIAAAYQLPAGATGNTLYYSSGWIANTNILMTSTTLKALDNASIVLGTGNDDTIVHNTTDTTWTHAGPAGSNILINNTNTTGAIALRLGTNNTTATKFLIEMADGTDIFTMWATGLSQFGGNVDATLGLDVTGAALTVGSAALFSVNNSTGNVTGTGEWNAAIVKTTWGGTGLGSYTAGDMLYYASGTALSKLGMTSTDAYKVLRVNSTGTAPEWVAAGGTAIATSSGTVTVKRVVYVNGSGTAALANANTSSKIAVIGVALQSVATANPFAYQTNGRVTCTLIAGSGATAGGIAYLAQDAAGDNGYVAAAADIAYTAGKVILPIGIFLTTAASGADVEVLLGAVGAYPVIVS